MRGDFMGEGRLITSLPDNFKGGISVPFGPQPFYRWINLTQI